MFDIGSAKNHMSNKLAHRVQGYISKKIKILANNFDYFSSRRTSLTYLLSILK